MQGHTRAKQALPSAARLRAMLNTATLVEAEEEMKSSGNHVYSDLGGEVVCVYKDIYTHICMCFKTIQHEYVGCYP